MTSAARGGVPVDASTRFRAPTYVRNVIERRRLLGMLRAGSGRQLVVIHAPAGYGKTTLAVQWLRVLEDEGGAVAWLGLHRAEDTRRYTLSALLELIARHPGRFVLTFDDWHLIDDPQVHHALVHLLDFAPPNMSLILTSRTRPRLPLSRLRVRRQLTEVDAATLRFDVDETRVFLVDLNGLSLQSDDVARLSETTDGWVAALQLVSLSLRDSADPAALIRDFSGRHHSIGEYLAENVLGALSADILEFLLVTSVCDRLCGDLAGALADRPDGQAMLEELERRDLFLRGYFDTRPAHLCALGELKYPFRPLDAEREWFRYHHLFADHLRRRLERDRPEQVPRLHRCASAWFTGHDLVPEAVTHALAAADVERATDLVERHAMPLVEHSRMASLLGLTARLPADAMGGRPALLMAVAWANCLLQRPEAAQLALDHLRRVLPGGADEMHSEADVVQACIDVYADRTDRAETLVSRSLECAGTYRPWIVAVAANIQMFCDIHAMRFRDARERQRWTRPIHDRTMGPFAGVYGRCFAGIAALAQLDLAAAEEHLNGAVALARDSAGRRSHAAQLAGALLGELHYERGELEEAERLLEDSRDLGAESGVVDFMVVSYALLARIKAHRGAPADSAELLTEGAKVAERLGLTRLRAAVVAERIRQLLDAGRVHEARWTAQDLPDGGGCHGGIAVTVDQIRTGSLAAVLSAEGDHDEAEALLEELIADLDRRGQARAAVCASVTLGGVQERAARRMAAERSLASALSRCVPAGLRQPVLDGGPEVATVLGRLVARAESGSWPGTGPPIAAGVLAELLAQAAVDAPSAGRAADLNARELAVLRMLDARRSNQQIAHALGVTVNTVKWYLKNIYAKLGETSRAEAVSTARRGGLLS